MNKQRHYTAPELREMWMHRVTGGYLTNPCQLATGGDIDPADEYTRAMDYLMACDGYFEAERVLKWISVYNHNAEDFDPRGPGDPSLEYALGRLGWKLWSGVPLRELGPTIDKWFMFKLMQKCRDFPFVAVVAIEETVVPLRTVYA